MPVFGVMVTERPKWTNRCSNGLADISERITGKITQRRVPDRRRGGMEGNTRPEEPNKNRRAEKKQTKPTNNNN